VTRRIGRREVADLALGATVLGTGGGGDPYLGRLMAEEAVCRHGEVPLVPVEELPADGLVLSVAMMGAPTVLVEKIPNGREVRRVVEAVERRLGERAVAVMSAEAGGINSTIPVAAAAELGLPLLDADGMGRAFPEIPMCSMNLFGVSATPMAVSDEKGNLSLFETMDNTWTERLSRTVTVEMGGSSIIALYPMNTVVAGRAVIAGTISRAIDIGRTLRTARRAGRSPLDALLVATGGKCLFRGKVVDVLRRTVGGFARGVATIDGFAHDAGSVLRIEFQNEHLVALRDGLPVASVPDLITVLDVETLAPVTTEGIRYGCRVIVVALPCAPVWRTPAALAVVGPRAFGYEFDYVPVEEAITGGLPDRD
jgi:DUF917 family protein